MTIETSHDSAIMTYGLAKDPRRPWILGLLILLGLTMLMVVGLFFGLRRPIPLPAHTAILISTHPAAAQKALPMSVRTELPLIWQKALEGDSFWPVILGLSKDPAEWKAYAILPRWRRAALKQLAANQDVSIRSYGLAMLVSASPEASDQVLSYTRDAYWWTKDGWLGFRIWPSVLLSEAQPLFLEMQPFQGRVVDQRVITNLALAEPASSSSLQDSDISLRIPTTPTSSLKAVVQSYVPLGDRPQVFSQQPIDQVNLLLGEQGDIQKTMISFQTPMDLRASREILSSFGIVSKRVIQIEDGTVTVERTLLEPSQDGTVFGMYPTTRFGVIDLTPEYVAWGTSTSVLHPAPATCAPAQPWIRLSSRAVDQLLRSMSVTLPLEMIRPLQFLESEGKLIVCPEG